MSTYSSSDFLNAFDRSKQIAEDGTKAFEKYCAWKAAKKKKAEVEQRQQSRSIPAASRANLKVAPQLTSVSHNQLDQQALALAKQKNELERQVADLKAERDLALANQTAIENTALLDEKLAAVVAICDEVEGQQKNLENNLAAAEINNLQEDEEVIEVVKDQDQQKDKKIESNKREEMVHLEEGRDRQPAPNPEEKTGTTTAVSKSWLDSVEAPVAGMSDTVTSETDKSLNAVDPGLNAVPTAVGGLTLNAPTSIRALGNEAEVLASRTSSQKAFASNAQNRPAPQPGREESPQQGKESQTPGPNPSPAPSMGG